MNRTRSFPQLLGIALMIELLWLVFAVFNSSEFYRRVVELEFQPMFTWSEVLINQLIVSANWALFTPVIVAIAERLPLVKPFRWRNAAALVVITPALAVARAAWGGGVMTFIEDDTLAQHIWMIAHSIDVRWHRNVFLTVVIIGVVNLVLAQRAVAERERQRLAEKKETAHAELQRIRAAMQPQFLFATLDAVKAQVARSPLVADQMLVELGSVLRKMLEFEKRKDVSLAEELEIVGHCLVLEKARTAGLFTTSVNIDEPLLRARIPPLLLHAIVQSAVLAEGRQGGHLAISAWATQKSFRLAIRNTDSRRAPRIAALEATRARLQRAFAERAHLEVRHDANATIVVLTMPLETEPSSVVAGSLASRIVGEGYLMF